MVDRGHASNAIRVDMSLARTSHTSNEGVHCKSLHYCPHDVPLKQYLAPDRVEHRLEKTLRTLIPEINATCIACNENLLRELSKSSA
jgi:hypothetical protein